MIPDEEYEQFPPIEGDGSTLDFYILILIMCIAIVILAFS